MDVAPLLQKTPSRSAEMSSKVLRVCICGVAQQPAEVLLSRLAAGDMFGSRHTIELTLQDSADKLADLQDLAEDLMDACYPFLSGPVRTSTALKSVDDNDIIILLTSNEVGHRKSDASLREVVKSAQNCAEDLNLISPVVLQNKVVVVAGGMALVAAGILTMQSPHLHPHRVLVVDIPTLSNQIQHIGGYCLAEAVCKNVQQWWSGTQESEVLTLGVGCYHGLPRIPSPCFVPLPVTVIAPCMLEVNSDQSPEWSHVQAAVANFSRALSIIGLVEEQGVQSPVCMCKL